MSQHKARQGKNQSHQGDAAAKARPVAPAPQQPALAAPEQATADLLSVPMLTPAMLPLLQRKPGNRAVQRLISARPIRPAPFMLQRLVTTTTASYTRFSQIKAMTLSDLHRYAEDQADWHKSPNIDPTTERPPHQGFKAQIADGGVVSNQICHLAARLSLPEADGFAPGGDISLAEGNCLQFLVAGFLP